jgi:glycosyltransferase involved in cell wall biosynthesis
MKVLFNCHVPFSLAHGGAQIQIEQTLESLSQIGVRVEPLQWFNPNQTGDILQHFGRLPASLIQLAKKKGMKVITADLLTAQGSRPPWRLKIQSAGNRLLRQLAPRQITNSFHWAAYTDADACIALTEWEASLMTQLFAAPREKVFVVPNGVEREFLNSVPRARGPWLVCTATLTERKRILELAEAAIAAQTPVWIIGKPYAETDAYAQRFQTLARQNPRMIRYEGPIADRNRLATIYREARGFVLLSTMESLSLSALEAAACECPLLLSDLPWARTVFKEKASYCPIAGRPETARALQRFYAAAPNLPHPPRPLSWTEVAQQLRSIYERVLSTSR